MAPIKIIDSTVFVNVLKVYSDQDLTFFNKVFQNHDVIFILNRNFAFADIDPCVLTLALQNLNLKYANKTKIYLELWMENDLLKPLK